MARISPGRGDPARLVRTAASSSLTSRQRRKVRATRSSLRRTSARSIRNSAFWPIRLVASGCSLAGMLGEIAQWADLDVVELLRRLQHAVIAFGEQVVEVADLLGPDVGPAYWAIRTVSYTCSCGPISPMIRRISAAVFGEPRKASCRLALPVLTWSLYLRITVARLGAGTTCNRTGNSWSGAAPT